MMGRNPLDGPYCTQLLAKDNCDRELDDVLQALATEADLPSRLSALARTSLSTNTTMVTSRPQYRRISQRARQEWSSSR